MMSGKKALFIALLAILLLKVKVKVRAQVSMSTQVATDNGGSNLLDVDEGSGSSSGGYGSGIGDDEDSDDSKEDESSKTEDKPDNLYFDIEESVDFSSTTIVTPKPILDTAVTTESLKVDKDGVVVNNAAAITGSKSDTCKDCPETIKQNQKGELETCAKALEYIEGISELMYRISEQGIEGPVGPKGTKGEMGEKGSPGSVIYKGQKGTKGDSMMGARGPMGPIGAPGFPGAKGDRGHTGPTGPTGVKGESIKGAEGSKGQKGECIMTKVEGPPGPPGKAGINIQEFNNLGEMFKMEKLTAPGTLAYVHKTGKFYARTPTGWATLLMHQLRHPASKLASTDRSLTRRAKQGRAKQRQRIDGVDDSDDKSNDVYNDDPPAITTTTLESHTATPAIELNKTLLQIPAQLRLIALNSPWSGNMHGIDYINYQCQKEAMESNLTGIFSAFLSTSSVDITSLIQNKNDKIVNLHNVTLFGSKRHLFRTGKKFMEDKLDRLINGKSSIYSFDGQHVILDSKWEINMLWHGAHIGGRHSRRNCQDWRTNSSTSVGIASDFLYRYILDQKMESCSSKLIVLCIELNPLVVQEYFERRALEEAEQAKSRDGDAPSQLTSPLIGEYEYRQFLKEYYEH